MNININIERLVLDGIDLKPGQGRVLKAAVEAELSALLRDGAIAPELRTGGAYPGVNADSIQMSAKPEAAELGGQIARAVYSGIGERK